MFECLAETNAGVDGDSGAGEARGLGLRNETGERVVDVEEDIVIGGRGLHRLRIALGMHQDHRGPCRGVGHSGIVGEGRGRR